MAPRRVRSWFVLLLAVVGFPAISKGQVKVPGRVAREIAQGLATHFDRIDTLEFRFDTTVNYLHRPDESVNWRDFEYRDAFYAYDARAGKQYLSCIDTKYGRNLRKQVVEMPSESRMLYEHQTSDVPPEGFVNKHFASAW
jgi:hypothetical protein